MAERMRLVSVDEAVDNLSLSMNCSRVGPRTLTFTVRPPISPDEIEQLQARELLDADEPIQKTPRIGDKEKFASFAVRGGETEGALSEEEKARAIGIAECLAELRDVSSAFVQIKEPQILGPWSRRRSGSSPFKEPAKYSFVWTR